MSTVFFKSEQNFKRSHYKIFLLNKLPTLVAMPFRLLYKRNLICYSSVLESRRGEIGIHDRLKIYWGQLRKGSSPFAGIFFNLSICRYQLSII